MAKKYGIEESCQLLGISKTTLYRLANEGVIEIQPRKPSYLREKDIKTLKERFNERMTEQ